MRYIKPTGFSEVTARLRKAEGWNDKRFAAPLADEPDEPSVIRTDSGATGEPVAWFCEWFTADGSPEWDQYHDRTDPMPAADEWEDRPPDRVTPLYATAQPAPAWVPLTDAEVMAACSVLGWAQLSPLEVARAIEAAHGIGASDAKKV